MFLQMILTIWNSVASDLTTETHVIYLSFFESLNPTYFSTIVNRVVKQAQNNSFSRIKNIDFSPRPSNDVIETKTPSSG